MGWTSTHRRKGVSHRDYFQQEFGSDHTIIADALVNKVWYAAVENKRTGEVYGLVVLIHWNQFDRDGFNFTYKDMSENMGPGAAEAPAKVLDALTPTENQYALAWRAQCRANLAAKAARPSVKGLRDGDRVKINAPVKFTNGMETDEFIVRTYRDRRGRRQVRLGWQGSLVRFPGWRDRVVEVTRL